MSQPKRYPNLNPAAAVPVEREQIFGLQTFFDRFRMRRTNQHGHYVPNTRYMFVKMESGETLMHPTYRHPALAEGHPVLYAGEAYFDNGRLEWWSNGSGNYRPDAAHAEQAGLPMDRFFSYEDVMQGRHKSAATRGTLQAKLTGSAHWPPVYRPAPPLGRFN
jgi:hypothetical protein